jgi:hypothetical protein
VSAPPQARADVDDVSGQIEIVVRQKIVTRPVITTQPTEVTSR